MIERLILMLIFIHADDTQYFYSGSMHEVISRRRPDRRERRQLGTSR